MDIPNLDNLINAIDCYWNTFDRCEKCPSGFNYLDDSGDYAFWSCDQWKMTEETLFFLKLYKYLVEENKNDTC